MDGYTSTAAGPSRRYAEPAVQLRGPAARAGNPRRDDRQPRQAHLGRRPGQGPQGRRQQHAAVHPGQDQQARQRRPTASIVFLDGEEAIKKMTVAKGMKVDLFASEKEFPELAKPVQMPFDPQGRLWVAVWPSYPHWKPEEEMNDKILIFEDTNGDGKADKMTVFADHLQLPDRLRVLQRRRPRRPGARPDVPQGHQRRRQGRPARARAARPGLGRHAPHGQQLRPRSGRGALLPGRHVPPHAGRDALRARRCAAPTPASTATSRGRRSSRSTSPTASPIRTATSSTAGARTSSSTAPAPTPITAPCSPAISIIRRSTPIRRRSTSSGRGPCPGIEILSSRHFPPENQGNLLVANVIGFQGILQYKLEDKGASFAGTEVEPILSSTDPNFRPSDVKIGPDGAI